MQKNTKTPKGEKVPVTTAPKIVRGEKVANDTPSVATRPKAKMKVVKEDNPTTPNIPVVEPITVELKEQEVKMLIDTQATFNAANGNKIKGLQQMWAEKANEMKVMEEAYKALHLEIEGFKKELSNIDELQRERLKGILYGLLTGSYGYDYNNIETILPTNDPNKIMVVLKSDITQAQLKSE